MSNTKGTEDTIKIGKLLMCSRHLAFLIYLISQQAYEALIPTLQIQIWKTKEMKYLAKRYIICWWPNIFSLRRLFQNRGNKTK